MDRIIYPHGSGVAVIIPAPKSGLTTDQIAAQDVPPGIPYRIVQDTDIPTDRHERRLWVADFSSPDGVGGQS